MHRAPNIFLLLLLFAGATLSAKEKPTLRKLLLSLPDSVFTNGYCFHENDSFPQRERLWMLDSAGLPYAGEPRARFKFEQYEETPGRCAFTDLADNWVSVSILQNDKNGVFFCIQSYRCDFVQCSYRTHFYLQKGKKLEEVRNVLPKEIPLYLFFDKSYLKEMQVDPTHGIDGIEYHFSDTCSDIIITINTDFFDKELFGEAHPMVRLDPGKMIRQELILRLKGRKYVIVP